MADRPTYTVIVKQKKQRAIVFNRATGWNITEGLFQLEEKDIVTFFPLSTLDTIKVPNIFTQISPEDNGHGG